MIGAIVFCGPQGAGKSTWFARHYADTHVRLNLDMLGTRHREDILLHACLAARQSFVIDNTNPAADRRRRYVSLARLAGFDSVECCWFDVPVDICCQRNDQRQGDARVPDVAIRGTLAKFEPPTKAEGFDRIWRISINAEGETTREELP